MASARVSDALWEEFHQVVNMSSLELQEWLHVRSVDEDTLHLNDRTGTVTGHRVVQILGKRRTDLTEDDVRVMRTVVEMIRARRGPEFEPTAGRTSWRQRLMTLGHDPLKPRRSRRHS